MTIPVVVAWNYTVEVLCGYKRHARGAVELEADGSA